jgi:hypothetical protein
MYDAPRLRTTLKVWFRPEIFSIVTPLWAISSGVSNLYCSRRRAIPWGEIMGINQSLLAVT